MFARLGAKAFLLIIGLALIFFGVGLIEWGIATALRPYVGAAWGEVIAGALFLLPPLIWALAVISTPPPKPQAGARQILATFVAALAKDKPWIALVGTALAGAAELLLNRNKSRK